MDFLGKAPSVPIVVEEIELLHLPFEDAFEVLAAGVLASRGMNVDRPDLQICLKNSKINGKIFFFYIRF